MPTNVPFAENNTMTANAIFYLLGMPHYTRATFVLNKSTSPIVSTHQESFSSMQFVWQLAKSCNKGSNESTSTDLFYAFPFKSFDISAKHLKFNAHEHRVLRVWLLTSETTVELDDSDAVGTCIPVETFSH